MYDFAWYNHSSDNGKSCLLSPQQKKDLLEVTLKSVDAFRSLNVQSYLIYGTLLGALRTKSPIDWDQDFDIGINKTSLANIAFGDIQAAFKDRGLEVHWDRWHGLYRVDYTNPITGDQTRGDVMLYHDFWNQGSMQRVGLESWLFFVNYHKFHQFPAKFVQTPLVESDYGNGKVWLPSDARGLAEYFYPNSLSVVKKPACAV